MSYLNTPPIPVMQHYFLQRRLETTSRVTCEYGFKKVNEVFFYFYCYRHLYEELRVKSLWRNKEYLPLYFVICRILQLQTLETETICFHFDIPPKSQTLITLANCSSSFSPIVLVKVSGYTRNIFCYVQCTSRRQYIVKSSRLLQNRVLNTHR